MAAIEIFKNESFGEVRVAGTSEQPLFCLADVCKAVELSNPSSVKARLDEEDVQLLDLHALNYTEGIGNSKANFVTESGFYDVILQSSSPKVKPFRKWITSEVLPSIRKTGSYTAQQPLSPSELILKLAEMNVENERKMKELSDKQQRLETEIEEIRQRTITDLHKSTIVAYVSRNNIKLDVKRYGAMGRKASSICKKRNIPVTKINDIRWGNVNVFPDEVLDEVFGMKGGLDYEN